MAITNVSLVYLHEPSPDRLNTQACYDSLTIVTVSANNRWCS